jgi:aspartate racemase
MLARAARQVEAAGANLLLLCTNIMHRVADRVAAAVRIPLLNIVDVTAAAVRRAAVRTVGLLDTAFAMEQDFYRDRLASHRLTVIDPEAADRAQAPQVIYDELVVGIVSETSRKAYTGVIDRLVAAGAQGIVLGCTEIELLIGPDDSPVPVFPTTRIHVEAAVDQVLTEG